MHQLTASLHTLANEVIFPALRHVDRLLVSPTVARIRRISALAARELWRSPLNTPEPTSGGIRAISPILAGYRSLRYVLAPTSSNELFVYCNLASRRELALRTSENFGDFSST